MYVVGCFEMLLSLLLSARVSNCHCAHQVSDAGLHRTRTCQQQPQLTSQVRLTVMSSRFIATSVIAVSCFQKCISCYDHKVCIVTDRNEM